jgi:hypothetical protein
MSVNVAHARRLRENLCLYAAAMVKKSPTGSYAYHRFHFIDYRWCIELLDIGGSMGIVPRQESISNSSMHHRELLKLYCWFASDR